MKRDEKVQYKTGVTIKDIAKEAGVSVATVSHALNGYPDISEKTKQKILDVAKTLAYVPSKSGRALRGISNTIAFMLAGDMPKIDRNGFTFGIMSGIYTITQETGYEFEILTAPVKTQEKIPLRQLCHSKNLAGLVVYGLATDMPYFTEVVGIDIPCILVDVKVEGKNTREISIDHIKASFEEVEYLIHKGFKNIAMLSGEKVAQISRWRELGYIEALQKYNRDIAMNYIVNCSFERSVAKEKAMELKKRYPEIDAFFCASDSIAIGVADGMKALGLEIPQDIAIAGFDDYPIAEHIYGGITTTRQYPYETGVECAKALVKILVGEKVPKHIPMKYKLIERASTIRKE